MRPAEKGKALPKKAAKRRGRSPDLEISKRFCISPTSLLLDLARSGEEGLSMEWHCADASIESGLKALAEQGILIETSRRGRMVLVQSPGNFARVFIACDRAGEAYELLGTEYSHTNIGEPVLIETSKAMVYDRSIPCSGS